MARRDLFLSRALLGRAQGKVKPALVMHFRHAGFEAALRILEESGQSLRNAIENARE